MKKKKAIGIIFLSLGAGAVAFLTGAAIVKASENKSSSGELPPGADNRLFDMFWQVVGREESWCDWGKWTANDAGSGVSVGWIQFNQRYGLLYLIQEVAKEPDGLTRAFGEYAHLFADLAWVKSHNLNVEPYKSALYNFIVSDFGRTMQRKAAYIHYWKPAQDWIDTYRPGASDGYRIIAGSIAVQFSPSKWKSWIQQYDTMESLNNAARDDLLANGFYDGANYRIPRQLENTKKALAGQFSCK